MSITYDLNKPHIRGLINQLRPKVPAGATEYKPKNPEHFEHAKRIHLVAKRRVESKCGCDFPDRATAASETYKSLYKPGDGNTSDLYCKD